MNNRQKELIEKLNLSEEEFAPKDEDVTISDLVELVSVLTDIVLGSEEE